MGLEIEQLSSGELVPERRFTNPEHSLADLAILEHMRARLRSALTEPAAIAYGAPSAGPRIESLAEHGERPHRLVLAAPERLLSAHELTVVGFFGQRRGDADPAVMGDIDDQLIAELAARPYVLSYSSLELPDGNWANLVLLQHAAGMEHWRASPKHAYAVRELAPRFYASIRLHNGALLGGLAAARITLLRTKYYDFGAGWWQAIREFRSVE